MKVICKNNEYGTETIRKNTALTIGKSYDIIKREVTQSGTVLIRVLCDDGIEREYLDTRFFSKDEVREQVINKVLEEDELYKQINKIIDGGKGLSLRLTGEQRCEAIDYAFDIALKISKWKENKNG